MGWNKFPLHPRICRGPGINKQIKRHEVVVNASPTPLDPNVVEDIKERLWLAGFPNRLLNKTRVVKDVAVILKDPSSLTKIPIKYCECLLIPKRIIRKLWTLEYLKEQKITKKELERHLEI